MKEISRGRFSREYREFVGRRKIEDLHYYYGDDRDHVALSRTLGECCIWTVIMYGDYRAPRRVYNDLPRIFRHAPGSWEQLFFIAGAQTVTIYRGSWVGSGYRYTHGIMSGAFALLARGRCIRTYVLSQGPRGGLRVHRSETLLVHGHELSGNYDISREEVNRTVPEDIRIYGRIR